MTRTLMCLTAALALSACGSGPKAVTPAARVTCTADRGESYVISFFRGAGFELKIAQSVDARDVSAICAVAPAASGVKP